MSDRDRPRLSVSSPFDDYPPRRRGVPPFVTVLMVVIVVLLGFFAFQLMTGGFQRRSHDPEATPRAITPRGDLAADEKSYIELFESASPSVVFITSLIEGRRDLSLNLMKIPQGTGSGFVWSKDGYVVTNYHVIRTGNTAQVTLWDHSTWDATLVGAEPDKDLAVLKIVAPADRLHPIVVGGSRDLRVGQKVFAIGNPFGLDQSMTMGIISGLNREIQSVTGREIRDVIQTDAAINPGNSGGPLLDSAGRLVGVNTAIYSPSGSSAGIGFAVPVDTVNRIVPRLVRGVEEARAGLGVELDDTSLRRHGIDGVMILRVLRGSSAERAGLRGVYRSRGRVYRGDIIEAVDGVAVSDRQDLFDAFEKRSPGDKVRLTVLRGRQRIDVDVTLQVLPKAK